MSTWIRGMGTLLALVILAAATPGYAVVGPPVPSADEAQACLAGTGPCAFLYETTENMSLKALKSGRRRATSALLGFAVRGTPLCPEELVAQSNATYCAINATGSDNISLKTGLGQFDGTMTVVVQEPNTPDSPESVIAKGHFTGKMDFSPAILQRIPFGTVTGTMKLDGLTKEVPFTGVFRLPFVNAQLGSLLCGAADAPLYLVDPSNFLKPPTFGVACVADNEMAIGFPTVRFEISFP